MAISISALKSEIKEALNAEKGQTADQDKSIDRIAGAIAEAVAKQIVTGIDMATVTPVLMAPPMGGTVTGTITLKATAK